ncbi:MAG: hypothetical protein PUH44_05650 [Bacteroidales bacterium]|nr:hypothetical protein [Bacteroidales bacterium]MDY2704359.1 hypothetical protein [Alloprevotella sp.]
MELQKYTDFLAANQETILAIRDAAFALHTSVGQTYSGQLPYSYHLGMVADAAMKYGAEVVTDEQDILPVVFGAYYHDSIEDARLTYNDVTKVAKQFMNESQAIMAAEVVYALTNDKGRTRAERAGEHYYAGIRATPYAPFVKLCDRLANMTHSFTATDGSNNRMRAVYQQEWEHFHQSITSESTDQRLALPERMVQQILALFD